MNKLPFKTNPQCLNDLLDEFGLTMNYEAGEINE